MWLTDALVILSVDIQTGVLGLFQIKAGSDIRYEVKMLNKATKNKDSCLVAYWQQGPWGRSRSLKSEVCGEVHYNTCCYRLVWKIPDDISSSKIKNYYME